MNLSSMWKANQAWQTFKKNHPRFGDFLSDVDRHGVPEGTDIRITLTYPDGQTAEAGLHVKGSDLALLDMLRGMKP